MTSASGAAVLPVPMTSTAFPTPRAATAFGRRWTSSCKPGGANPFPTPANTTRCRTLPSLRCPTSSRTRPLGWRLPLRKPSPAPAPPASPFLWACGVWTSPNCVPTSMPTDRPGRRPGIPAPAMCPCVSPSMWASPKRRPAPSRWRVFRTTSGGWGGSTPPMPVPPESNKPNYATSAPPASPPSPTMTSWRPRWPSARRRAWLSALPNCAPGWAWTASWPSSTPAV